MRFRTTTFILMLAIALPNAVASAQVTAPVVPTNLEVTDGSQPFLVAAAEGTQNYVCLSTSVGFAWAFFGPQATLYVSDQQVATHFLSPSVVDGAARATWQDSADTSRVWAAAVASSTDSNFVAPGAIPWLLLKVVGNDPGPTEGSALTSTTYIQRVNTAGGIAPATGCKNAKDVGKKALVPYTTDYVFWK